MKRWIRKQVEEAEVERVELAVEKTSLKTLIHDVADVVIQLQAATEDLERALVELAAREDDDDSAS